MSKPNIIMPTIGRRLWYIPSLYDRGGMSTKPSTIIEANETQPCDAGVVFVHGERLVNLLVTDHNGNVHKRTSVHLVQPGDSAPTMEGGYAVWMDYQQQQAQPKPQGSTTAKYFAYGHLPAHLQLISKPLGQLADLLEQVLPNGPEKSAGMRKLLEAKDCFVRAALDATPADLTANAPITDSDRLQAWLFLVHSADRLDPNLTAELQKFDALDGLTEAELQTTFMEFVDTVVRYQRAPKQHTEDVDHFEG